MFYCGKNKGERITIFKKSVNCVDQIFLLEARVWHIKERQYYLSKKLIIVLLLWQRGWFGKKLRNLPEKVALWYVSKMFLWLSMIVVSRKHSVRSMRRIIFATIVDLILRIDRKPVFLYVNGIYLLLEKIRKEIMFL